MSSPALDSHSTSDSQRDIPADLLGQTRIQKKSDISALLAPKALPVYGRYRATRLLGEGGMGTVYEAYDPDAKRTVAIKVLTADSRDSEFAKVRFRGEAEKQAGLSHQNIVQIYDIQTLASGETYLVLEYVDGGDLAKLIKDKLPHVRKAAEWVEKLARAIHVAHEKEMIHRDLKPANILVTKDGDLKIADFGLAKQLDSSLAMTANSGLMGTPLYMSPEQALGKRDISRQADIYALGVILYELLLGKTPFKADSREATLRQIIEDEPASLTQQKPGLPSYLCAICLKCLEKDPANRYASALELAEHLRAWLDTGKSPTRPKTNLEKAYRALRRNPREAAIASLFAAVLALFVFAVVQGRLQNLKDAKNREQLEASERLQNADKELADLRERELADFKTSFNRILKTVNGKLANKAGLEPLYSDLAKVYEFRYGKEIDAEVRNREALLQMARAYADLGKLMKDSARKSEAEGALEKAEKLAAVLEVTDNPDDKKISRFEQSDILLNLAELKFKHLNNPAGAEEKLKLAEGILNAPRDASEKNNYAQIHHFRGEIENEKRKLGESIGHYRKAIENRENLRDGDESARNNPLFARDLARSYGYIGDAYHAERLWPESDTSYWKSHVIREKLVDDAKGLLEVAKEPEALENAKRDLAEYQFQLARSWGNLANHHLQKRSFDVALYFQNKSLEIRDRNHKDYPSNQLYFEDLAQSYAALGEYKLQQACEAESSAKEKYRDEARKHCEQAATAYAELAKDLDWYKVKKDLVVNEIQLLKIEFARGGFRGASAKNFADRVETAQGKLKSVLDKLPEEGKKLSLEVERLSLEVMKKRMEAADEAEWTAFLRSSQAENVSLERLSKALLDRCIFPNPTTLAKDPCLILLLKKPEFDSLMRKYEKDYYSPPRSEPSNGSP